MQKLLEWLRSVSIATDVEPEIEEHEEYEEQDEDELNDIDKGAQDVASGSDMDGSESKDSDKGEE